VADWTDGSGLQSRWDSSESREAIHQMRAYIPSRLQLPRDCLFGRTNVRMMSLSGSYRFSRWFRQKRFLNSFCVWRERVVRRCERPIARPGHDRARLRNSIIIRSKMVGFYDRFSVWRLENYLNECSNICVRHWISEGWSVRQMAIRMIRDRTGSISGFKSHKSCVNIFPITLTSMETPNERSGEKRIAK
jgi:hypothetical protein